MLSYLYIENVAVIEKAQVSFTDGLNILTGETGAGKSIIIDSINAVSGNRVSKDLVRTGAQKAVISAAFSNVENTVWRYLNEIGIEGEEDGELIIDREIRADGKSSCRVNGKPITVSLLRDFAPYLVRIQGQHESYDLLSPEKHRAYVDAMAENSELLSQYSHAYHELKRIGKELDQADMDEEEKSRRCDMLRYQINELESASIRLGEKDELLKRKNAILNGEAISKALIAADQALKKSDRSALEQIRDAASSLEKISALDSSFAKAAEKLRDIEYDLQDCSDTVEQLSDNHQFDPDELDQIEERLDLLYRLGLKYGNEESMLDFLENAKEELEGILLSDERKMALSADFEAAKAKAVELAKKLSAVRKTAGEFFENRVMEELRFLDMPNVIFKVQKTRCPLNAFGCDDISFMISVNLGEDLKPLSKVASGGELSRIMLAIKTVLSDKEDTGTLIFDEIDAGISGRAAQKVGLKLKEIAKHVQTFCITHLAQIAALADTHFLIQKDSADGKTYTKVHSLDHLGRREEIARIIGGSEITETILLSAEEMIEKGKRV